MRYKPRTPAPRYLGAVEEYDIYVTPDGAVIARYGDRPTKSVRPAGWSKPRGSDLSANSWYEGMLRVVGEGRASRDVAERIAALIACFAPDLCAAHNKEETT